MVNLFKKYKKTTEVAPRELARHVKALEARLEEVTQKMEELKQEMRKAITRVGVVRFNSFKETGGDQSFSIALLDESNNGVVVTSHYGREMNRVYAKPIQGGASEHELSVEEKEAIQKAVHD